ncbi:hypothetical protein [Mycolicibacterium hippocampi]|uniref:Uncharacterized protein n=1 Tax=Mycolicibacterium hippocampi TaxID=659824 RepID=A0A7I9ZGN7_9MYCO|nr:hypothetical protein [Mycolicibacterium hippocampi]GFH00009.1 hypothetical protein MHIP_04920 [Mycolicibacterium hippocampi]
MVWAVIGGLGGAGGAIAAAIALIYAHKANTKADTSNTIATDSKGLAVEANSLACESNTIASEARELAREANDYSHRAEARETEPHDVRWTGDWVARGIYRVTKHGADEARQVAIDVSVDGEHASDTADRLTDGYVDLRFPAAARQQRRHDSEWSEYEMHRRVAGDAGSPPSKPPPIMRHHDITEDIRWTTRLGTPQVHHDQDRKAVPRK